MVNVGSADQREVPLIGDGKDDAAIGTLEKIAFVMIKQTARDDMAAPHQPEVVRRWRMRALLDDRFNPGATSIDQHPGIMG